MDEFSPSYLSDFKVVPTQTSQPVVPAATPDPVVSPDPTPADVTPPVTPNTVEEQGNDSAPEPASDPVVTQDSAKLNQEDLSWDNLHEEDQSYIISSATGGKFKSAEELQSALARIDELENKVAEPQFKNDKEKQIYEYLSKYPGEDYGAGLQSFIRLESLDLTSIDPKQALKEVFILKHMEYGFSVAEAEDVFEQSFNGKYEVGDRVSEFNLRADGEEAKNFLRRKKEEVSASVADKQTSQAQANSNQEREYEAARTAYEQSVAKSLRGDKGEFNSLEFNFGQTPDEKFTFKIPDLKEIEKGMLNYQDEFFEKRYLTKDASGKTQYNTEQMKIDQAVLLNKEAILKQVFEQGKKFGELTKIKERANIPPVHPIPAVNPGPGGIPKTFADSLRDAKVTRS